MRLSLAVIASPILVALVACSTDLPAPDNHNADLGTDPDTGTPDTYDIQVDCNSPPTGAIDAEYNLDGNHSITASGGDGFYMWAATGLPAGLLLNGGNPNFVDAVGTLSGQPSESGTFEVDVTVTDGSGGEGTATCDVLINERFDVTPFPDAPHLPCVVVGENLATDYVAAGIGDGSPITCTLPERSRGNGEKPNGVEVVDCAITGAPAGDHAERYGTWAWIVEAEQSGVVLHVPYCYTTTPNPGTYDVKVYRGGDLVTDTAPIPGTGTFNATDPFGWGDDDPTDPWFEIISEDDCAPNACFYGFTWATNASSPFSFDSLDLNDDALVRDDQDRPIGFAHGLQISSEPGPIDSDYANRVWIQNVRATYCIADNEGGPADNDGPCEGSSNIAANAGAIMQFAIIMTPE
jgi:hypothetical protein